MVDNEQELLSEEQLFVQFHHDGESYEGEIRGWSISKTGKRVKEIAQAQVAKLKAMGYSIPPVLFHKVIHTPSQNIVEAIHREGIVAQMPSEYKDLVPTELRSNPVVWLSSDLNNYTDNPVFIVRTGKLDKSKLIPVTDTTLNWWIYAGDIHKDFIVRLGNVPWDREKVAEG